MKECLGLEKKEGSAAAANTIEMNSLFCQHKGNHRQRLDGNPNDLARLEASFRYSQSKGVLAPWLVFPRAGEGRAAGIRSIPVPVQGIERRSLGVYGQYGQFQVQNLSYYRCIVGVGGGKH